MSTNLTVTAHKESTGVKKWAGLSLKDIAEQLGTVPASDYLITRLPIALSEEMSGWTVNAEAGRKGKPRPLFIIVSTYI